MNATDKFVSNIGQIVELSKTIHDHAENHFDRNPDTLDWEDVVDTELAIKLLKQVAELLILT